MINKFEKEALVIKLLNEGKTIKQIATEAHISFKDIGGISRKLRGETEDSSSPKSLETLLVTLFKNPSCNWEYKPAFGIFNLVEPISYLSKESK